jgi:CHAT domain-containing protein
MNNPDKTFDYKPAHLYLVLMYYLPARFDEAVETLRGSHATAISELVETLKTQADIHWGIDPRISLHLANCIITVGHLRGEDHHTALGLMARGDATGMLGNQPDGWANLRLAGKLFLSIDDRVGWGRTRIGLLLQASDMNRMRPIEAHSKLARRIFLECDEAERAIRLDMNMVKIYQQRGDYKTALELGIKTIELVEEKSAFRDQHLIRLYTNFGYIYAEMGQLQEAVTYHQMAQKLADTLGETAMSLRAQTNIAYMALIRGRYPEALKDLQEVVERSGDAYLLEGVAAYRLLAKCYLSLNRFAEARNIARQITQDIPEADNRTAKGLDRGYALIDLATAEANLGHLEAAQIALNEADAVFGHGDAHNWRYHARLRRGQIALRQGDAGSARQDAEAAADYFEQNGEQINSAAAHLLVAQAAMSAGDGEEAVSIGQRILQTAQGMNIPWLSYSSYLMLAQVAEAQHQADQALAHYEAAASTVESMQRGLTITLRPDFLQSREDAFQGLVRLYLQQGQAANAFESLERNKSQIVLSQIANRDQLRWRATDAQSQTLLKTLEALRADHHAFFELAYGQATNDGQPVNPETRDRASQSLEQVERHMREITDQLYLRADPATLTHIEAPSLGSIQAQLAPEDALLAFYPEAHHLWAFVVDQAGIHAERLPMTPGKMWAAYQEIRKYVEIATQMARHFGPFADRITPMTTIARIKLQELYAGLLRPLERHLQGRRRLVIVPSGALHYLPFHMLYDGEHYLIESHEIVTLPAAGLLTAPPVFAPPGALVLADSQGGLLPSTIAEARQVATLLGGQLCGDGAASLDCLAAAPCRVLHIAAHGQYRIDQPERSYIQLAGQQVFTDDLLQRDLSYELVTLSACETGRAAVVPGDELVGIGRGFLYAGAGALITSLWRIDDQLTVQFMESLYSQLQTGASKASALRGAQLKLLMEMPQLHPAFWGAFQLVGNADPLSA